MLLVTWDTHGFGDEEHEGIIVGYVSVGSVVNAIVIPLNSKKLVHVAISDLQVIEDMRKHDIRKQRKKVSKK